jgi:dTMP kinase
MKKKGLFITFEGTEGTGKSTQIELLEIFLKDRGHKVLRTFEPGGTELGTYVREILLHAKCPLSPEAETLLYMASRAQIVDEVIAPALREGRVVLSDRWLDATVAYQGYGLGVDRRWIDAVARKAVRGLRPDLTLFLDLDVRTGLKRAIGRGKPDRVERRKVEFHERVRRGYFALARRERRIRRVPVTTVEETQARIRREVERVL